MLRMFPAKRFFTAILPCSFLVLAHKLSPLFFGAPDSSSAVIALSVVLAALVVGNIACFAWCLRSRRKEPPTPPPPAGVRDANTEVELGRLR